MNSFQISFQKLRSRSKQASRYRQNAVIQSGAENTQQIDIIFNKSDDTSIIHIVA